jgi:hypothetical protein
MSRELSSVASGLSRSGMGSVGRGVMKAIELIDITLCLRFHERGRPREKLKVNNFDRERVERSYLSTCPSVPNDFGCQGSPRSYVPGPGAAGFLFL